MTVCQNINGRAADTRFPSSSAADSGAQQSHKLHPPVIPERLHALLKRPGGFWFPRDREEGAICFALNDLM